MEGKDLEKVDFDPETREELAQKGVSIIQSTDLVYEISASMSNHLGVNTPKKVMKETLYLLSTGVKAGVFATLSAADAGAITNNKEVVAFGGLEQGLDTATVLSPPYSGQTFQPRKGLEIREIICKPRTMEGSSGEYYGRAWGSRSQTIFGIEYGTNSFGVFQAFFQPKVLLSFGCEQITFETSFYGLDL